MGSFKPKSLEYEVFELLDGNVAEVLSVRDLVLRAPGLYQGL